ncbi:Signal-induced proliferation-associated 1-like protein 2 [Thelohanellus kitauei]|uniref:Signal-induced proliferation-associated 1-like protein 2 n=1 Tax=Thelohanellus kitauei TaxID=669202 RepID=A0A0C2J290_THEKT|nr:Signal-induced proliferation-associated 1-like protein 2 [Thelohanellus kitauei]
MSLKASKSPFNSEIKKFEDLSSYMVHCDSSSVTFNIEESAQLYADLIPGRSRAGSDVVDMKKSTCECYRYTKSTSSDFTASCDNHYIIESHGSICSPPISLFFEQGIPPNYFHNHVTDKTLWTSASFYPTIFDHVHANQKRGNVIRMTTLPSVSRWDNPFHEPHYFRFEHIDYGALFYREYFYNQPHDNFIGIDPVYGPYCISIKREYIEQRIFLQDALRFTKDKDSSNGRPRSQSVSIKGEPFTGSYISLFRVIARFISTYNLRITIPNEQGLIEKPRKKQSSTKSLIQKILPLLSQNSINAIPDDPSYHEDILKLDETISLFKVHKIGVIYCAFGQRDETEMYGNNEGSERYNSFLELLGDKVMLKNFSGYSGMLDTKTDNSGTYTYYTKFVDREIMFHVSTLIPSDAKNSQQITRKRYLGNDMVTIVFQDEGALPFSPKSFVSQFQHVFIVVQAVKRKEQVRYRVGVIRQKDVPPFGPYVTQELYYHDDYFRQFLLTKIINAEYACMKSPKFLRLSIRTRYQTLLSLKQKLDEQISEKPVRLPEFFRTTSQIKFPKIENLSYLCLFLHGAITWPAAIFHPVTKVYIDCTVCVSTFCMAVICHKTKDVIISVLNRYLLAWKHLSPFEVQIFHRAGNSFSIKISTNDNETMSSFFYRITSVSNIKPGQIVTFMPPEDPNNFLVDDYAIVKKLPLTSTGVGTLKIGDQVLEIENIALNNLSMNKFYNILYSGGWKRLLVVTRDDMFPPPSLMPSLGVNDDSRPAISECAGKENNILHIKALEHPQIVTQAREFSSIITKLSLCETPERKSSINHKRRNMLNNNTIEMNVILDLCQDDPSITRTENVTDYLNIIYLAAYPVDYQAKVDFHRNVVDIISFNIICSNLPNVMSFLQSFTP